MWLSIFISRNYWPDLLRGDRNSNSTVDILMVLDLYKFHFHSGKIKQFTFTNYTYYAYRR